MNGKQSPSELISPEEAINLFKYAKIDEVYRVKALYATYRQYRKTDNDISWYFMCLLSFVYDTGRVQGIREERAKTKTK